MVRLTITSPVQGQIVVVSDSPGSCALKFATVNAVTELASGQSCETTGGTTLTYTGGTASVTNRTLTVDVRFDVTEVADGSAGRTGTGAMTDQCSPQSQEAGAP
jgi:hypothetical protein